VDVRHHRGTSPPPRRGSGHVGGGGHVHDREVGDDQGCAEIVVKNLAAHMNNSELEQVCSAYGAVVRAKTFVDNRGVCKGYGFVLFDSVASARRAIASFRTAERQEIAEFNRNGVTMSWPSRSKRAKPDFDGAVRQELSRQRGPVHRSSARRMPFDAMRKSFRCSVEVHQIGLNYVCEFATPYMPYLKPRFTDNDLERMLKATLLFSDTVDRDYLHRGVPCPNSDTVLKIVARSESDCNFAKDVLGTMLKSRGADDESEPHSLAKCLSDVQVQAREREQGVAAIMDTILAVKKPIEVNGLWVTELQSAHFNNRVRARLIGPSGNTLRTLESLLNVTFLFSDSSASRLRQLRVDRGAIRPASDPAVLRLVGRTAADVHVARLVVPLMYGTVGTSNVLKGVNMVLADVRRAAAEARSEKPWLRLAPTDDAAHGTRSESGAMQHLSGKTGRQSPQAGSSLSLATRSGLNPSQLQCLATKQPRNSTSSLPNSSHLSPTPHSAPHANSCSGGDRDGDAASTSGSKLVRPTKMSQSTTAKVFVGGLARATQEAELFDIFAKCVSPTKALLCRLYIYSQTQVRTRQVRSSVCTSTHKH
jgi:RNA recognition motif-containing protein